MRKYTGNFGNTSTPSTCFTQLSAICSKSGLASAMSRVKSFISHSPCTGMNGTCTPACFAMNAWLRVSFMSLRLAAAMLLTALPSASLWIGTTLKVSVVRS